ncbi:MAG: hypothetical protein OK422_04340 [Thaumarchaeota archaeon]|nr:hypothetical protein [Nitrososphaerota archaeon]
MPVYTYSAIIEPKPTNRPQTYQILGGVAKRISKVERTPVIQSMATLQSVQSPITSLNGYSYEIPEVGTFHVDLSETGHQNIPIQQFDNYTHLVNRLVDMALTVFTEDYYKFHPDAPYVLRDEPYFDQDLISKTGILDSKRYYRGIHTFNGTPAFVLNRETELRSNGNLLNEIRSLKGYFEETRGENVDLDNPPQAFMDMVNSMLRGKSADVKRYPGPAVRKIKEVTWRYRAKDTTPGMTVPQLEYFRKTYGITGLDPLQPLVAYEVEGRPEVGYHIPELLSLGHDFRDLQRRIPKWRRQQVWGIIHPDCKNQLVKIFEVLTKIDASLRENIPEIYPKVVEISRDPLEVTDFASRTSDLKLVFGDKEVTVKHPFDITFYHQYSDKKIPFARQAPASKMLVLTNIEHQRLDDFIVGLQSEFKRRNNAELEVDYGALESRLNDFAGYDLVMTVGGKPDDDEGEYKEYKETIQNRIKIPHQHVTEAHATEDSVMQLVMQLTLKLGFDPWLLPPSQPVECVVGVHSYQNPETGKRMVFALALNKDGSLLKQFEPADPANFRDLAEKLIAVNQGKGRTLYLVSFDRFGLIPVLEEALASEEKIPEYCLAQVEDQQEYFRFFETWIPKKAPRFGKAKEAAKASVEAFEVAPEGLAVRAGEGSYYLVTGRTIEKNALRRGCPTPIKVSFIRRQGDGWEDDALAKFVFSLCMMGRASGHLTRLPSPLYYLRSYAHYYHYYGLPDDESLRQRIFYI